MAHENATPRPWRKSITLANGRTIRSGSKIVAEIWTNGDSMEANADLVLDAVNTYDTLRAERDALREENERLRKAASLSAMYLKTGFIRCPRCGSDVDTTDTDAEYTLRKALGE